MQFDIPVQVNPGPAKPMPSLNVKPILHEVKHSLSRLLQSGEPSVIDLRAMPLAPGEDEAIREALGDGEVVIKIDALGPSIVSETAYSGVWWVEHRNSDDVLAGLYIEIAHVPEILRPDQTDLADSLARLDEHLSEQPYDE